MNDKGVEWKKDGNDIDWRQGMHLVDSNGNNVKPVPDHEWHGNEEGNNAVKEAVLDEIIADILDIDKAGETHNHFN